LATFFSFLTGLNLVIEGDVDLSGVAYSHRLVIRNAVFSGVLDLSEAHFKRTIDVTNCLFQKAIRCFHTEIRGSLVLSDLTLNAPADTDVKADFSRVRVAGDIDGRGLQCNCGIDFQYAQISGNLHFLSTSARETFFGGHLDLQGAKILGDVILYGVQAKDEVRMAGAEIAGHLLLVSEKEHRTRIAGILTNFLFRSIRAASWQGVCLRTTSPHIDFVSCVEVLLGLERVLFNASPGFSPEPNL